MDEGLRVRLQQDAPIPLDVEIDCAPGEVLALTGPSGGGKSTILRAIAGLYTPKSGQVLSKGAVWFDSASGLNLPAHKRSAGLVFQNYALFPHLDALGNITAAMDHLAPAERIPRAQNLLKLMHLSGLERRRPAQLSGGQQQRVALARAMARDPDVLLLDEPFSAVDKVTRTTLYDELRDLRGVFRIPIIFVTHDLDEAAQLADRLCLIDKGRVLESGPPSLILTQPRSEAAARLAGLKNVFRGHIVAHEGAQTILDFDGASLHAAQGHEFNPGEAIAWSIPSTHVVLSEGRAGAASGASNTLQGTIETHTPSGETMRLRIALDGAPGHRLAATLPIHDDKLHWCAVGQRVSVHLPVHAIHLMRATPQQ